MPFCDMPSEHCELHANGPGLRGLLKTFCASCTCVSDAARGRISLSVSIGVLQKKDSAWAEPHNKNPLEKTTLSRQGITAQSKEMKDEGMVRSPVQTVALIDLCT